MLRPISRLLEAPDLTGSRVDGYGWVYSAASGAMVWKDTRRPPGAYLAARGIQAENYPLMFATGGFTPTSQTVVYQLVGATAKDIITGAALHIAVGAVGTAPTGMYVGLYDSAGVQLAVSANLASNGQWLVGQPAKFAFTAPYTVVSSGGYYIAFLQNGAFGTTQPQLGRTGGGGWNHGFQTGTTLTTQNTQAGQATLPATAAYTDGYSNQQLWVGWY